MSDALTTAKPRSLRVGVIAGPPDLGWADEAHVPAVLGLAGLDLWAVAGHGVDLPAIQGGKVNTPRHFQSGHELIADPDVDVVTVAGGVPWQREFVLAALRAGKHVYCEWPLGRDLAEARELAAAARAAKVKTAVGLQAHASPVAHQARRLIEAGAIGRLLSAAVHTTTAAFGPKIDERFAFSEVESNGVTLLTVQGGHTLDITISVLGELSDAFALASTQFGEIEIANRGKRALRSTHDHVLLLARFGNDIPLSVEVAGGRNVPAETFTLEAIGEDGVITLVGEGRPGFQTGRLMLALNGERQAVDDGELACLADLPAGVAAIYSALRNDIVHGSASSPDFDHAARLTSLNHDMLASSRAGVRKRSGDWPER